ncbi:Hypothetical_protein [Hexamita inflata]|uniref:Hypothetical_protein n=1 Tax=Hexamita inflata TaxID=28002 RepID=A0AA86QIA9_9EUKA|nr:Hypothetical protein HINF_LOCUS47495 [Hexamita inflata]CAI9959851.1 Hypothetical protein HINF_LOCUS47496 [Hexamita inflata]
MLFLRRGKFACQSYLALLINFIQSYFLLKQLNIDQKSVLTHLLKATVDYIMYALFNSQHTARQIIKIIVIRNQSNVQRSIKNPRSITTIHKCETNMFHSNEHSSLSQLINPCEQYSNQTSSQSYYCHAVTTSSVYAHSIHQPKGSSSVWKRTFRMQSEDYNVCFIIYLSQQNQSMKNQIKELIKSLNKILNGNQKPKGNSFTTAPPNNEQQLIKIHTSTSNKVK